MTSEMAAASEEQSGAPSPGFPSRQGTMWAVALLALLLIGALPTSDIIAAILLRQQDIWLLGLVVALGAFALVPMPALDRPLAASSRTLALAGLVVAVLCYLGHYGLLAGYDFTRDEQMASFDARIFGAGHLVSPLPPDWQAHAAELNRRFMPTADPQLAWISGYLPMNAALRALFGLVGDPALAGPACSGLSILLLWSCARRIWPDRPETAVICVLLLVSAGQFMLSGMTAYAMPAHLVFNLLWLRLFLTRRLWADFACLAAGLVATGLHQPLFHPLFVAPFMLLLVVERDWRRLALFVPGYAVICAFWLYWPIHIQGLIADPHAIAAAHVDPLTRLRDVLGANRDNLATMAANLLRFFCWQNVLLLPLLLLSWPAARTDRFAAALVAGLVLPVLAMTAILPSQGFGFGYRYLHPVLGNAVLLAGYGWNRLSSAHRAVARSSVLRATAAGLLVLLPVQAWMTHRIYAPFAAASARIDRSGADYALLPEGNLIVLHDLVLNRPDLSNRPTRLVEPLLRDPTELAARICHPGVSVVLALDGMFDPMADALSIPRSLGNDARLRGEGLALEKAGCRVALLR